MTIEIVIINFIVICLCFVIVNLLLFPRNRDLERRVERQQKKLKKEMRACLARQVQGADSERDAAHIALLEKRLRRPYILVAYEAALKQVLENADPQAARGYFRLAATAFSGLCAAYERKKEVYQTCLVYVLGQMLRCGMEPDERMRAYLYARLHSKTLICRRNAFSAVCGAGDAQWAVKAVLYMNRNYGSFHDLYVTEGLCRFSGNPEELADRLWEVYEELNSNFRLAVLNYLCLVSGRFCEEMLGILKDTGAEPELHYAAIRYLGRYPFSDAKPLLLHYLEKKAGESRTYAAESALALGEYPGDDTFSALKKALFHPEWDVRMSASASLEKLGIDYLKLSDVINSSDRYAREIAQYRLEESAYRAAAAQNGKPEAYPALDSAAVPQGGI